MLNGKSKEMLRGGRLVVAGHVTEVHGPVQVIAEYLNRNGADYCHVSLPFSYSSIKRALVVEYRGGRERQARPGHRNRWPALLLYVLDLLLVLRVLRRRRPLPLYIGIDNLNALAGVIARRLGWVDMFIYYVVDYTPRRFKNPLMNHIFHFIDRLCARRADYIWNLSERIAEVRRRQGVSAQRNMVVPVGVWLEEIQTAAPEEIDRHRLVLISHLTRYKGVQLIIEAMREIVRSEPRARLHITGAGPYEAELKRQAADLVKGGSVVFRGVLSRRELFRFLPTCGVALAPYLPDKDSVAFYSDVTKPKEYLACGLPVVITSLPFIAEAIGRQGMGVVVEYNKPELVAACLRLMRDDEFYQRCRRRALEYAQGLDWTAIYDRAFQKVLGE